MFLRHQNLTLKCLLYTILQLQVQQTVSTKKYKRINRTNLLLKWIPGNTIYPQFKNHSIAQRCVNKILGTDDT